MGHWNFSSLDLKRALLLGVGVVWWSGYGGGVSTKNLTVDDAPLTVDDAPVVAFDAEASLGSWAGLSYDPALELTFIEVSVILMPRWEATWGGSGFFVVRGE